MSSDTSTQQRCHDAKWEFPRSVVEEIAMAGSVDVRSGRNGSPVESGSVYHGIPRHNAGPERQPKASKPGRVTFVSLWENS
jgi:hypothetical protein